MYKYKRWPLHPPPYPNESLSSWVKRIAIGYDIEAEELLACEFGINLGIFELYSIDLNPPIDFLSQLSERTGIESNAIRTLTAQSYVPLLIDTFEGTETSTFNNYTNQFNVFTGRRENVAMDSWIPWFNPDRFADTQGCEICLKEDLEPYLRLHWRFPWMMSCPIHKLLLERGMFYSLQPRKMRFSFYKDYNCNYNNSDVTQPLDDLYAMDAITLQAVTKGVVELPSGNLHGGVWLRILRTLIEELNSLVKTIGRKNRSLMIPFWQELDSFVKARFIKYNIFEQCDYKRQLKLMLVAALVFKAIFAKETKFTSRVVNLLTSLPIYENDFFSVYGQSRSTIKTPCVISTLY